MGCSAWSKAHFLTAWEGRQTRASWVVWGKGQVPLFHPSPSVLKSLALSLSQEVRETWRECNLPPWEWRSLAVTIPASLQKPVPFPFLLPPAMSHLGPWVASFPPFELLPRDGPPRTVVTLPKMKQYSQTFCSFCTSETG